MSTETPLNGHSSGENKLEVSLWGSHPQKEDFETRLKQAGYKVTSYNGSPYCDANFVLMHGDHSYADDGAERWLARIVPRIK